MSEGIAATPAPVSTPTSASSNAPSGAKTSGGSSENSSSQSHGVVGSKTVHDAQPTPKTEAAPPELFEVKVNGRTVKMTRQQLIDNASMSAAAHEKFNEAKKLKDESTSWKEKAKKDFISALHDPDLGLTKDQIRGEFEKWYAKEFIDPETLTPEQRRLKELEDYHAKTEQERKESKLKSEQEEMAKLTNSQKEFIQNQIIEAMETSGLPKSKFVASRMAFYMRQAADNKWDAPMSMIIQQVKNERQQMVSDMSEGMSVEQLISHFGEGVVNKIRQHDLKQLREKRGMVPAGINSPSNSSSSSSPRQSKRTSWAEVQQNLRDLRAGKKSW